ncbi:glucosidase II beta subunit-like protein-domain-containing protein [Talaromyces proteolyticus]|uniref:Endoplasmic reticulum lectin n=1 Tax=Talaromyces proteolyticus TaxID=1131652 RepID=A0AAD4PYD7_9EURO|nr:glucosidase II beta subunit-like protein-domain-containing protein [Talaromyces proteolyticus]KAH8701060.1 glucosidase II beta subunit-like protein-domain-containing protein [Talaromyces proteolyticus]
MDGLANIKRLTSLLCLASVVTPGVLASKRPFSIHDDVLAFPQYDVVFPEEYILKSEATALLKLQEEKSLTNRAATTDDKSNNHELDRLSSQKPLRGGAKDGKKDHSIDWNAKDLLAQYRYKEMTLDGLRYLCNIPRVSDTMENNSTAEAQAEDGGNKTEEENEITRATDRGLELLQEMEGTCMFYVSGWWSYSFCYKKAVKQFHALPAGPGVPNYPPMEDPATHSFVLGRFHQDEDEEDGETDQTKQPKTEVAELQTKGESRYLVQRLGGGTTCDLTGAERKIEVQFHCHPQTTDRIGWIKELTTCSYLMVIHTPRLCHDVAFQLPQPEDVHAIECREILDPEEIADFEAMKAHHDRQKLVNSGSEELYPVVGGIQVGAKKQVGSEGKVIEKGRIASISEEKIQIVAKRENGDRSQLSKEDMEKLELNPKEVEAFQKNLDKIAKGKDWRLELVQSNGARILQGIVDTDEEPKAAEDDKKPEPPVKDNAKKIDDKKKEKAKDDSSSGDETGSEEVFKEEL